MISYFTFFCRRRHEMKSAASGVAYAQAQQPTLMPTSTQHTQHQHQKHWIGQQGSEYTGPLGLGGDAEESPDTQHTTIEVRWNTRIFAPATTGGLPSIATQALCMDHRLVYHDTYVQPLFLPALTLLSRCCGSSTQAEERDMPTPSFPAPLSVAPPAAHTQHCIPTQTHTNTQ